MGAATVNVPAQDHNLRNQWRLIGGLIQPVPLNPSTGELFDAAPTTTGGRRAAHHIVQQGVDRQAVFFDHQCYLEYLHLLDAYVSQLKEKKGSGPRKGAGTFCPLRSTQAAGSPLTAQ